MQFNLTPQPSPPSDADATAAPTPRVVVIPTATANASLAVTPDPTQTAIATVTPTPIIAIEQAPTAVPSPIATATPAPTSTPAPTATSAPPVVAAPTLAPVSTVRVDFTAEDWRGGFFRGDGRFYGRPWVAVYGALSDYPRATLSFTLDATPGRDATVSIAGLDDEWAEINPIAVEVNGLRVFEGPSPFLNWDGIGRGEDAAWSTASFAIPRGVLRAGRNEMSVANLSPVASFNAPPYVLLSEAVLEVPGRAAGQTVSPTPVPIVPSNSTAFAAQDWDGGFHRGDSEYYGRPWTAIYGAASDFPGATLRFRLDAEPSGPAQLTITGLDDELAEPNPIPIEVNGQRVYEGPSPFVNWDGIGVGANAAWTEVEFLIPAEVLRPGRNEIAISNLSSSANFSAPPYVLLSNAALTVPGAEVTGRSGEDAQREPNRRDKNGGRNGDD